MAKLSELRSEAQVHERDMLDDLDYRREIERTRLANDVAVKVIAYRAARGLSQTALAKMLGMRQPNVARLEAGEHEPSLDMLARLSTALGLDFSVEVKPGVIRLRHPARGDAPSPARRHQRRRPPASEDIKTHADQARSASRASELAQAGHVRRAWPPRWTED